MRCFLRWAAFSVLISSSAVTLAQPNYRSAPAPIHVMQGQAPMMQGMVAQAPGFLPSAQGARGPMLPPRGAVVPNGARVPAMRVAYNPAIPTPTDTVGTSGTGYTNSTYSVPAATHYAGTRVGQDVTIPQQGAVQMHAPTYAGGVHGGQVPSQGCYGAGIGAPVESHHYSGPVHAESSVQAEPVYAAPVYSAPVYQQAPYQAPVYQAPVYQAPMVQSGGYITNSVCNGCGNYGCNGGCQQLAALGAGALRNLATSTACNNWFGGIYYINLNRDDDRIGRPLAHGVGYEETPVLTTGQARMDDAGGIAVRFGRTLTQNTAFEFLYWQVFPDGDGGVGRVGPSYTNGIKDGDFTWNQRASHLGYNIDSEVGMGSLQTAAGGAVSDYFMDSRFMEVRRNFDYRNFEWNFLQMPYTFCGNNCGKARIALLAGIRYFRADEDFALFADDLDEIPGNDRANEFIYASEVDNHLVGVQIGGLMNYQLTCKLSASLGAKVGIYGNHMESRKSVTDGNGDYAVFGAGADAGRDFSIESEKDDVAFLSELDMGLAYCLNHKWRLSMGYKVFALSGYADATKQIPATFDSYSSAGLIHDQSSLILHGIYLGAEFTW